jgi:hypothetical protein
VAGDEEEPAVAARRIDLAPHGEPIVEVRVTVEQGGYIDERKHHASTLAEPAPAGCGY